MFGSIIFTELLLLYMTMIFFMSYVHAYVIFHNETSTLVNVSIFACHNLVLLIFTCISHIKDVLNSIILK